MPVEPNSTASRRALFALVNFGIAQPLYSVLARNPQFLIVRDVRPGDLLALTIAVSFLIPATLIVIEFLSGFISSRIKEFVFGALFAALAGLLILPYLNHFRLPGLISILISATIGSVVFYCMARFSQVRAFFRYLGPISLIVAGLFLYRIWEFGLLSEKQIPSFPGVARATPVVMILLDEMPVTSILDRNLEIDSAKYPNFARLSRESIWFRNATTVSPDTPVAISAIMTGKYPQQKKYASVRDYPANLFTLLGSSYDLRVIEPVTKLCPYPTLISQPSFAARFSVLLKDLVAIYVQAIIPEDLAHRFPPVTSRWSHFWSRNDTEFRNDSFNERTQQFSVFVNSIDETDKPALYFLHILLPHSPWRYLPSGKRYDPAANPIDERRSENFWKRDPQSLQRGLQRHLLQVGFVDRLLGQVLDRLQKAGIRDQALIVVTSDHGICFRYGEMRRDLSKSDAADLLPVVLMVKLPGQKTGIVNDRNVESIDILPTIADALHVPIPWKTDGSSALNAALPERKEKRAFPYYTSTPLVFPQRLALSPPVLPVANEKWIGREASEFAGASTNAANFELVNPEAFDRVDLKSDFVPALISGRIRYGQEASRRLLIAVAVNGVVRATVNTFPINPKVDGFAVIVPEESFDSGRNHVELFEIRNGSEDSLVRLQLRRG